MSEKKVCKIDDEAMKNVAGGQGSNAPAGDELASGYDASFNVNVKYDDPNSVRPACPECGKDLGITVPKGSTFGGVCPHCKKTFTVTA